MSDKELNAVVSQRIEVSPYLIILTVVPDGWELPDFTPGPVCRPCSPRIGHPLPLLGLGRGGARSRQTD